MTCRKSNADCETGEGGVFSALGDDQDDKHEQEREHYFDGDCAAQVDMPAVSVGAERTGLVEHVSPAVESVDDERSGDSAGELGDPVCERVDYVDSPGHQGAQRHGWVDVTARDRAERVHESEQSKAKGQRYDNDAAGDSTRYG